MDDPIPNKYHCPKCGRFLSNVYAQIDDVKLHPGAYLPDVKWNPYGTCSKHGELVIQPHDDENWGCRCNIAHDWDSWDWGDIDL